MNKIIDENYLDLIIDNILVRNAESENGQAIKNNDRYSIINVLNPNPYPCELGEAHAAGTIAMLLEWAVVKGYYSTITGYDVNRLIIRGADRSNQGYTYPNKNGGYGTLDIYSLPRKLNL